jgi:hypothetical protein
MRRHCVAWTRDAINQRSAIWLAGPDRSAITRSVSAIDDMLANMPLDQGHPVHEGLRFLEQGCLRILYAVYESDGRVEVASVARKPSDSPPPTDK